MMHLLLVLKLLGILISGGSALVALFSSKILEEFERKSPSGETRIARRLTGVGKLSFVFVISGLLISFVSQALEQSISNKENAENQQQAFEQLEAAKRQQLETQRIVAELQVQSAQTRTILTNVQLQGLLARQAIDVLSTQTEQSESILTNVQVQTVIAQRSVDELSIQSKRTESIVQELEVQGRLAGEQLDQLQRSLSRFERIEFDAVFELSTNEAPIRALIADMDRYVNRNRSSIFSSGVPGWLRDLQRTEGDNGNLMYALTSAFGMIRRQNLSSNESFILSIDLTEVRGESLRRSDSELEAAELLGVLRAARFNLAMNKQSWPADKVGENILGEYGDLRTVHSENARHVTLRYFPESKRLFAEWIGLQYPKTSWRINGEVVSIRDLANAQVLISLELDYAFDAEIVAKSLGPIYVQLQVDNLSFSFTEFDAHGLAFGSPVFGINLPVSEHLFDGKDYLHAPFVPMK